MAQLKLKQVAASGATNGQVATFNGSDWVPQTPATTTYVQEQLTAQNITGTDTAISDTLASTPISDDSVIVFLNGVYQKQGSGLDYSISGQTITWLASSGTADDMLSTDDLTAYYVVDSGGGSAGGLTLSTLKTANYTALAGERVIYDPSGGTFTITAPGSPATGASFGVKNTKKDITQITIDGNSNDIEDPIAEDFASTTFLLGVSLVSLVWVYDGTNWVLI